MTYDPLTGCQRNCEWVSSLPLAWQLFANGDLRALISVVASYYHFDVAIHAEFPGRVAISKHAIVGGVVRDRDLVAKLKITKIFIPACLSVIRENLCSRKFPAIRYIRLIILMCRVITLHCTSECASIYTLM